MSIQAYVDEENAAMYERWSGDITAETLEHYWSWFSKDPAVSKCRTNLADIRGIRLHFDTKQLRALAEIHLVPLAATRRIRLAVVVDDPVPFGVSRQFQVFTESFVEQRNFASLPEARAWLGIEALPPVEDELFFEP